MQPRTPDSAADERILKISGQNVFLMSSIRQKGEFIGFSIKINEKPVGVILDAPLTAYVWHQVCFSLDGNGYFRFNLDGETLLTQRVKNQVDMFFATKTTLTFGSDDKRVGYIIFCV